MTSSTANPVTPRRYVKKTPSMEFKMNDGKHKTVAESSRSNAPVERRLHQHHHQQQQQQHQIISQNSTQYGVDLGTLTVDGSGGDSFLRSPGPGRLQPQWDQRLGSVSEIHQSEFSDNPPTLDCGNDPPHHNFKSFPGGAGMYKSHSIQNFGNPSQMSQWKTGVNSSVRGEVATDHVPGYGTSGYRITGGQPAGSGTPGFSNSESSNFGSSTLVRNKFVSEPNLMDAQSDGGSTETNIIPPEVPVRRINVIQPVRYSRGKHEARTIVMQRGPSGFGYVINCKESQRRAGVLTSSPLAFPVFEKIVPNSIADRVGILPGDLLLEVNGKSAAGFNIDRICRVIKMGGDVVTMKILTDSVPNTNRVVWKVAVPNKPPENAVRFREDMDRKVVPKRHEAGQINGTSTLQPSKHSISNDQGRFPMTSNMKRTTSTPNLLPLDAPGNSIYEELNDFEIHRKEQIQFGEKRNVDPARKVSSHGKDSMLANDHKSEGSSGDKSSVGFKTPSGDSGVVLVHVQESVHPPKTSASNSKHADAFPASEVVNIRLFKNSNEKLKRLTQESVGETTSVSSGMMSQTDSSNSSSNGSLPSTLRNTTSGSHFQTNDVRANRNNLTPTLDSSRCFQHGITGSGLSPSHLSSTLIPGLINTGISGEVSPSSSSKILPPPQLLMRLDSRLSTGDASSLSRPITLRDNKPVYLERPTFVHAHEAGVEHQIEGLSDKSSHHESDSSSTDTVCTPSTQRKEHKSAGTNFMSLAKQLRSNFLHRKSKTEDHGRTVVPPTPPSKLRSSADLSIRESSVTVAPLPTRSQSCDTTGRNYPQPDRSVSGSEEAQIGVVVDDPSEETESDFTKLIKMAARKRLKQSYHSNSADESDSGQNWMFSGSSSHRDFTGSAEIAEDSTLSRYPILGDDVGRRPRYIKHDSTKNIPRSVIESTNAKRSLVQRQPRPEAEKNRISNAIIGVQQSSSLDGDDNVFHMDTPPPDPIPVRLNPASRQALLDPDNRFHQPLVSRPDSPIPISESSLSLVLPPPPEFDDTFLTPQTENTSLVSQATNYSPVKQTSEISSAVQASFGTAPEGVNKHDLVSKSIFNWSVTDVTSWLEALTLGEHANSFRLNSIDGAKLTQLDRNGLISLGVVDVTHRRIIDRAVYKETKKYIGAVG